MLDFYLICDVDDDWQEPQEGRYVGSISLADWDSLSSLWALLERRGIQISYFEDSRVRFEHVSTALRQVRGLTFRGDEGLQTNDSAFESACEKMRQVFEKAQAERVGIMCFCD